MSRRFLMAAVVGALLIVGAGCGSEQVAIPARQMNGDSALSSVGGQPIDLLASSSMADAQSATVNQNQGTSPTATDMRYEIPTSFPGILPASELSGKQVTIATAKGNIVFDVLDKEAPKAASNFIALARSGYYDGLVFHRVVPGFVIQGGDPKGDGTGGPGYKFEDEPVRLDYEAGIVAMANAGPDTNGSQFFIVLEDQPSLPKDYTIFGRVTSGMDVVRSIVKGDVMDSVVVADMIR